ncbi:MAG: 50S ribosomal protein L13 [Actinomycetota bacterium]
MQKTHAVKLSEIDRKWWIVDATDIILGRLAADVAHVLRGKHKAAFVQHLDNGDNVIVVNASKIRLSGNKATAKVWYRHSGFPGGLTEMTYDKLLATRPEKAVEKAITGMLPRTRLGRAMAHKLKVYAGPEHPHESQQPQPLKIGTFRGEAVVAGTAVAATQTHAAEKVTT